MMYFVKAAIINQSNFLILKRMVIFSAIYSKNINKEKYPELRKVDFLFFASTHRSIKGKPSLCLHVAGNWKEAELGGRKGKVCPTLAI